MKVFVALGFACVAILLSQSSLVRADVVTQSITGELADGGTISGTFGVDLHASDGFAGLTTGSFTLVDLDIRLTDSTSFVSTSGFAASGTLFQSAGEQELSLFFISDDDNDESGVFSDGIAFGPFTGDVNFAAPIQGEYLGGGFLDGSGSVNVNSVTVQSVPEPSNSVVLSFILAIGVLAVRRRSGSAPLSFGTAN